jgi:hypothetical protein
VQLVHRIAAPAAAARALAVAEPLREGGGHGGAVRLAVQAEAALAVQRQSDGGVVDADRGEPAARLLARARRHLTAR